MTIGEIAYLSAAIAAFVLFAAVLAYVSESERRRQRRAARDAAGSEPPSDSTPDATEKPPLRAA